jgi:TRAP-type C4-dicarboxylate transport system permease small subunit
MLTRVNDWVTKGMLVAAATLAFLLCFLVVADVLGRDLFGRPVKGTPELVSSSIVIICFLQAAYAIRSGGMLHVDFAVSSLPKRWQAVLAAVGALVGAAFFALVCWGSFGPAAHAWNSNEFEGEGALRVPAWPARFIIVLGTALATIQYLIAAWQNMRSARAGGGPVVSGGATPPLH